MKTDFPALAGKEPELAGFVWWHGWNDFCDAKPFIPALEELIAMFNEQVKQKLFPGGAINQQRVGAVEETIKAIKAATTQAEMKRITRH